MAREPRADHGAHADHGDVDDPDRQSALHDTERVQHARAHHRAEQPAAGKTHPVEDVADRERDDHQQRQRGETGHHQPAPARARDRHSRKCQRHRQEHRQQRHAQRLHDGDADLVGAGFQRDRHRLRQRAGGSTQERRQGAPAVHVAQIERRAERHEEGAKCEQRQADRIGGHAVHHLRRRRRAERHAENRGRDVHQRLRDRERSPGQCQNADGDHRAGEKSGGHANPVKDRSAAGADRQRFDDTPQRRTSLRADGDRGKRLVQGSGPLEITEI